MKPHPIAELFPLMEGPAFDELVEDIQQNGLRDPIITCCKEILDGRNRLRACKAAQVEPRFQEWPDPETATAFIISKNLHRRNLDTSQRAMIAAKIADLGRGTNQHTQKCGTSQQQAADAMNVSLRLVQSAKEVVSSGDEDLRREVEQGKTSVTAAASKIRRQRLLTARDKKSKLRRVRARGKRASFSIRDAVGAMCNWVFEIERLAGVVVEDGGKQSKDIAVKELRRHITCVESVIQRIRGKDSEAEGKVAVAATRGVSCPR